MDQTSSGFSCPELQKSLYMMAYLSSSRLADCDVTIERTIHRFYNSESYDSPIYSFQEVKDIITHYLDVLRNGPPSLFSPFFSLSRIPYASRGPAKPAFPRV